MKALLSILALYNFDNSIFDNFSLPPEIDKDDVINNLLMELAELEILYANPDIMKTAIGFWSKKELPVWQKLYQTTVEEYNPIWNQFRTETFTDKQTRDLTGTDAETRNLAATDAETRNLAATDNETRDLGGTTTKHSETTGETQNNGSDTTTDTVYGFNSTSGAKAKEVEQQLGTGNTVSGSVDTEDNTTDTGTVEKNSTDTGTINKSMTDTGTINKSMTDTGTVINAHEARYEGHTGIVPVQKLLEMQREVVQFNVINYIIGSFKTRFCIMIY